MLTFDISGEATYIEFPSIYCKFGNFRERFIFDKLKPLLTGKITMSFTDMRI